MSRFASNIGCGVVQCSLVIINRDNITYIGTTSSLPETKLSLDRLNKNI